MQERRLGKGLDVLFASETVAEQNVKEIAPGRIRPNPAQPRRIFDEEKFAELRGSIARDGILQGSQRGLRADRRGTSLAGRDGPGARINPGLHTEFR